MTIERQIIEAIKAANQVLITSHVSPDGDSIGSQLAAYDLCQALGVKARIINQDRISPRYAFLEKYDLIELYQAEAEYPHFDLALLLECTELPRAGTVTKLIADDTSIMNIDHHPGNPGYGYLNLVDEGTAAAAIMIYDLFREAEVELSPENANELFVAILTDTGRFGFSNTDARSLSVCSHLIELGAQPRLISNAVYAGYPEAQIRLMGELTSRMEIHHDGRTCFLVCDKTLHEKYGDEAAEMEGLVNYAIYTEGVVIGALLRELEKNLTKVSLRSHEDYDVAALARTYGGGGHTNAAGCHLKLPLAAAKENLLNKIKSVLN